MTELLFECYNIPAVTYGIDALFSCRHNQISETCLIVNCGYHSTHIIPVLNGKVVLDKTRRINVGGFHVISFLQRLLQLKYPAHGAAITISRVEEMINSHSKIAYDYTDSLKQWMKPGYYDEHVQKVQLPFSIQVVQPGLTLEQQKERKKELAKRLMDINARKREERLAEDEETLDQLLATQDLYDDGSEEEYRQALESHDLQNTEDLIKAINMISQRIEKNKQKMIAAAEDVWEEKTPKVKPGLQPPENEDLITWLNEIKRKKQEILDKKLARKQKRQDMAKRRTVAAQERMRIISQLARNEKGNDDFGMRDEDWDVYKTISRDGGDSDSEAETERLLEFDELIRQHEPSNNGIQSAEAYQLHLGVELIRAPEVLFQPAIIGIPEAGIAETIEYVFKLFDPSTQLLLADNVFLTGGCACLPGIKERLARELREMRPYETTFQVHIAKQPDLDAWHGAQNWANTEECDQYLVSRDEYNEFGGEYLKQHFASNSYFPTPVGSYELPSDVAIEPLTEDDKLTDNIQ